MFFSLLVFFTKSNRPFKFFLRFLDQPLQKGYPPTHGSQYKSVLLTGVGSKRRGKLFSRTPSILTVVGTETSLPNSRNSSTTSMGARSETWSPSLRDWYNCLGSFVGSGRWACRWTTAMSFSHAATGAEENLNMRSWRGAWNRWANFPSVGHDWWGSSPKHGKDIAKHLTQHQRKDIDAVR